MIDTDLLAEVKRLREHVGLLLEAMGEDARNRVRMMAKEYDEFAPLQDLFDYEEEEE